LSISLAVAAIATACPVSGLFAAKFFLWGLVVEDEAKSEPKKS
jgi:hypothetical protein